MLTLFSSNETFQLMLEECFLQKTLSLQSNPLSVAAANELSIPHDTKLILREQISEDSADGRGRRAHLEQRYAKYTCLKLRKYERGTRVCTDLLI